MEERKDFIIWYISVGHIPYEDQMDYLQKCFDAINVTGWKSIACATHDSSYVQIVRVDPSHEIPDMENILTLEKIQEILEKLS